MSETGDGQRSDPGPGNADQGPAPELTEWLRQLGATPPLGMDLITFYRTMRSG